MKGRRRKTGEILYSSYWLHLRTVHDYLTNADCQLRKFFVQLLKIWKKKNTLFLISYTKLLFPLFPHHFYHTHYLQDYYSHASLVEKITALQIMKNGSGRNAEEYLRVWRGSGEQNCFSSLTGFGFRCLVQIAMLFQIINCLCNLICKKKGVLRTFHLSNWAFKGKPQKKKL